VKIDVRFNDRRRFPRVSVNKAAFIMRFPFSSMLISDDSEQDSMEGVSNTAGQSWKPPEFVPAVVTELGGPGLLIETPFEVRVGERVVVILKMSDELTLNSLGNSRDISLRRALEQKEKSTPLRIIEDIGEVRRISHIQDGLSIAVELTGLRNADLNELIQETELSSQNAGVRTDTGPTKTDLDFRILQQCAERSLSNEPVANVTL
jgi:hypothetical protein